MGLGTSKSWTSVFAFVPRVAVTTISAALLASHLASAQAPSAVSGTLRQWHEVTLTLEGPTARETDTLPNPFLDYRMVVTFTHASGAQLSVKNLVEGF